MRAIYKWSLIPKYNHEYISQFKNSFEVNNSLNLRCRRQIAGMNIFELGHYGGVLASARVLFDRGLYV